MPQINIGQFIAILAVASSLSACGDTNSKATPLPHPADWVKTHKSSDLGTCAQCHGEDMGGGISRVSCMSPTAVSGFTCHATNPIKNPVGCVSCHGAAPFGPYGSVAPNRKFGHDKHTPLVNGCSSCHPNAGYGTPNHAKATPGGGVQRAFVNLTGSYKAKSHLSYGYDQSSGKCLGTNCHGGQDSPVWTTGTITMATDCILCHVQGTALATPQYNSFYSGLFSGSVPAKNLHATHLGRGASCTDCHNIGILTNYVKHFSGISTNTFSAPGATIGGIPTSIVDKNTGVNGYDPVLKKCSNLSCHSFSSALWNQ